MSDPDHVRLMEAVARYFSASRMFECPRSINFGSAPTAPRASI